MALTRVGFNLSMGVYVNNDDGLELICRTTIE